MFAPPSPLLTPFRRAAVAATAALALAFSTPEPSTLSQANAHPVVIATANNTSESRPRKPLLTRSPGRVVVVTEPPPSKEQREFAALLKKQELERKREQAQQTKAALAAQAKALQAEQKAAQQMRRAEAETARLRKATEHAEQAQAERQAKLWAAPLSAEEWEPHKHTAAGNQRYMEQQRQAEETQRKRRESECQITPVMNDVQIADCARH